MGRFLVPDVVGMRFEYANRLAAGRVVTLANPDPDGPPISALAWDEEHDRFAEVVIERQDPQPGHLFTSPWSSLRVWLAPAHDNGPASESVPARPTPPPSTLVAHDKPPTGEGLLDLTGGGAAS